MVIIHVCIRGYVYFGVLEIGFVLHKQCSVAGDGELKAGFGSGFSDQGSFSKLVHGFVEAGFYSALIHQDAVEYPCIGEVFYDDAA